MCTGIFLSSLLFSAFFGYRIILPAILSGAVWALGNVLSALAVRYAGLSGAPPVWMGTGIFASFILGIAVLKESVNPLFSVPGVLLLFVGICTLSLVHGKSRTSFKGMALALVSSVLFGVYLLPLNLFNLRPESYLFSMSLGIFLLSLLLFSLSRRSLQRDLTAPGLLSGAVWNIANMGSLFAVNTLGLAVGFPLTQLALFVSIIWGVAYFKEFRERKKNSGDIRRGRDSLFGSSAAGSFKALNYLPRRSMRATPENIIAAAIALFLSSLSLKNLPPTTAEKTVLRRFVAIT